MTKAKKGLIITLFAAVMVFAFGAASVFADTTNAKATWDANYTQVTISGCTDSEAIYNRTYTDLTKRFVAEPRHGEISVHVNAPDVDGIDETTLNGIVGETIYFDLNYAVFGSHVDWDAQTYKTIKGEYANGAYTQGIADSLIFRAPDYVVNKAETATIGRGLNSGGLCRGNWNGEVIGDEEYDSTLATEQNFTLSLDVTYDTDATGGYNFVGAVPDKAVKVNARALTPDDAKYYFDSEDNVLSENVYSNFYGTVYDGSEHTFIASPIEGWTPVYEVFNDKTGGWDKKEIKLTDVQEKVVQARIYYQKNSDATVTSEVKPFRLYLEPAATLTYGFEEGNVEDNSTTQAVPGTEYDAWSFVEMIPAEATMPVDPSDETKAYVKALNKAYAAAAEANATEALAAYKEYVEISAKSGKNSQDTVNLALVEKDMTSKEKAALNEKYETLMRNFDVTDIADDMTVAATTGAPAKVAIVKLNVNPEVAPVIEFTNSPTAVTYKAKALKKKAKSFTVEAASTNGATVNYKLVNAPKKITINKTTGKVTLKKGLKKGTYKVKVQAYLVNPWHGQIISENQAIKITVKK